MSREIIHNLHDALQVEMDHVKKEKKPRTDKDILADEVIGHLDEQKGRKVEEKAKGAAA